MSRQRLAGALVALALLLGAGGGAAWYAARDEGPGVDGDATPVEHAGRACDAFAAAIAGIRRNAAGKQVLADLDRADREARAAVFGDPIYAQLASAILLARQLIKDDATDGLDDALAGVDTHCTALEKGPSAVPSPSTGS